MTMQRREFISAAAGALAFSSLPVAAKVKRPEPNFIWSYLVHFGVNSWKDVPLETQDPNMDEKWLTRCCANHVRFDEPSWGRLSDALANHLKGKFGAAPRIVACGRMAIPAAHAFAVERGLVAGVETVAPPPSWTEVVEQSLSCPYANAVNGALLHYDWPDLLK